MAKTLCKISVIFAAFTSVNLAHAGIHVEPYLGYYAGKTSQSGTVDKTDKGLGYGARLGYSQLGFSVGLDYMTGKWTSSRTGQADIDVTPTNLGVFVGFQFPILLRVFGTYNFQAKGKLESGGTSHTAEGNGLKLGVGFTGLPFIAINAEYMTTTLNKYDGQSLTPEMKQNMYGLSVSLPLDL